jgi:hypothetical protein
MLYPQKHFDTSGKSPAVMHRRAIFKTAHGTVSQRALARFTHQCSLAIGAVETTWSKRCLPPRLAPASASRYGEKSRAYEMARGGARRDLEDLRAAINYHARKAFDLKEFKQGGTWC